jgi:RNA recognition motif-containing protein
MNQNQNPKLYVGNLNFEANEEQVRELFGTYGGVEDVKVVMDRISGRSRGFAFVRMATPEDAEKAKEALHGYSFQGKTLVIDFARAESPAGDRPRMGGGGDRGPRRPMGEGRREWGGPRSDRGGNGGGGFRSDRGNGGGFYNR